MLRNLAVGLLAGAAGTAALNITTSLDMAVRARPASTVPATVAGGLANKGGIDSLSIENEDVSTQNRQSGAGVLLGFVTGLGIGAAYGAIRPQIWSVPAPVAGISLGLAAMVASDGPTVVLGVDDPREWGTNEWLSDLIPHMIYGIATAVVYDVLSNR